MSSDDGQSATLFQTACAPDGSAGDQRPVCFGARSVMRREHFPWIWALITVLAFAALTTENARAHDKTCDGNPVPARIKVDCCGEAEHHQLKPEQISRGPNNEYIVSFEGYTFVIPADKVWPSNDPCSHIFFENVWQIVGGNQMRFPGTPDVHCFLTPLDF
jgi:hypothetical protein